MHNFFLSQNFEIPFWPFNCFLKKEHFEKNKFWFFVKTFFDGHCGDLNFPGTPPTEIISLLNFVALIKGYLLVKKTLHQIVHIIEILTLKSWKTPYFSTFFHENDWQCRQVPLNITKKTANSNFRLAFKFLSKIFFIYIKFQFFLASWSVAFWRQGM